MEIWQLWQHRRKKNDYANTYTYTVLLTIYNIEKIDLLPNNSQL